MLAARFMATKLISGGPRMTRRLAMTDRHPGEIDVGTAVFRIVTIAHVAEMFDCSDKHVRRMITAGKLEGIKDGGRLMVTAESILAYKQRLRENGGEPVCETCGGMPPPPFICPKCART